MKPWLPFIFITSFLFKRLVRTILLFKNMLKYWAGHRPHSV